MSKLDKDEKLQLMIRMNVITYPRPKPNVSLPDLNQNRFCTMVSHLSFVSSQSFVMKYTVIAAFPCDYSYHAPIQEQPPTLCLPDNRSCYVSYVW